MTDRLTFKQASEAVVYDPDTGELRWRHDRGKCKAGELAGYVNQQGYIAVCIDYVKVLGHQVAWLLKTGKWPSGFEIDHRDLDGSNNRWSNLRKATKSQQRCNQRAPKNNKSGAKGVFYRADRRRWIAYISVHNRRQYLGQFETLELASEARRSAAEKAHGEFVRHK